MQRQPIDRVLDVGVKAINAMLTVGCGQRLGLIAGSGVGKSVLLGMLTKFTSADVVVIGLIGERGREVKEFIEQILGPEGMGHAVVVAAPADNSPLLRIRATNLAHLYAEYFRAQGKDVLLLVDSMSPMPNARSAWPLVNHPPRKAIHRRYSVCYPTLLNAPVPAAPDKAAPLRCIRCSPKATICRTRWWTWREPPWMGKWCSAERSLTPRIIPPSICPVLSRV